MNIKNDKDYENALERLDLIFDAKIGSREGEELKNLCVSIEKYENMHYPI